MYFPYFITYITVGLTLGVIVFVWALKTGQFKDQQRARFLPLEDEPETSSVKAGKMSRFEIYGLFFLAFAGLAASAAVLIFSIYLANR